MEARKITVVSTRNQKKSVIMSAATTLAELKSDLRANNIDYDDMTFFEGTSKVELKNDASVLPHDVPYKGTITNELVFMLTNTNKKIRSGADVMSRTEAYNTIKSMGLQDACKKKFGKNFTQCSTADLISLIKHNSDSKPKSTPKPTPKPEVKSETKEEPKERKQEEPVNTSEVPTNNGGECVDTVARAAISRLVEILGDNDTIEDWEKKEVLDILGGEVAIAAPSEEYKPKSSSPYDDDEIDAMFSEMGIN